MCNHSVLNHKCTHTHVHDTMQHTVNLKPRITYVLPSGYKIEMVKKGSTEMIKVGCILVWLGLA